MFHSPFNTFTLLGSLQMTWSASNQVQPILDEDFANILLSLYNYNSIEFSSNKSLNKKVSCSKYSWESFEFLFTAVQGWKRATSYGVCKCCQKLYHQYWKPYRYQSNLYKQNNPQLKKYPFMYYIYLKFLGDSNIVSDTFSCFTQRLINKMIKQVNMKMSENSL